MLTQVVKRCGVIRYSYSGVDVKYVETVELRVEGELTIAGTTRPVVYELELSPDGRLRGTLPVTQTEFGIKPYRGFMGALKVRDAVEIAVDAQLAVIR